MMRWVFLKYSVSLVMVFVSGYALMSTNFGVQELERDVARLDRTIMREEEALRVLKAEWAYLNNPVRLEELAQGYMTLERPESSQLISAVPAPENFPAEDLSEVPVPARSPLYFDISTRANEQVGG